MSEEAIPWPLMPKYQFHVVFHILLSNGEHEIGHAVFKYEEHDKAQDFALYLNKVNPNFQADVHTWTKCDCCCEYRDVADIRLGVTERPSDPSSLCCVLYGCTTCHDEWHTGEWWHDYIESDEARANGHMWLEI